MIAISDNVQTRRDAPSGTIILNRPDRRNAISREIVGMIQQAFEDFLLESSVRVVILTGTGNTFCSGSDLHQIKETASHKDAYKIWHDDARQFVELIQYMRFYPKPIIAGINGWVVGNGCALMLACDLVIAGSNAQLMMPEAHRGLSAALSAPLINFRTGASNTSRILLSGAPYDASEVHRLGLFNEVVGEELVWARAQEMAHQCAKGARESQQMTKQILHDTIGESLETQLMIGAANMAAARTTRAAEEGVAAFLEKRPADWDNLHQE